MASYSEYVNYFENLCVNNTAISHVIGDPKQKGFFRKSLEEVLSGSFKGIPAGDYSRPIFVFINYITDYEHTHQTKKKQQLMFWILKSFKTSDFDSEMQARSLSEDVVEQFLVRMQKDSEEGHALFARSFDKIDKVRCIPIDYNTATTHFVGMQVTMTMEHFMTKCYELLDW